MLGYTWEILMVLQFIIVTFTFATWIAILMVGTLVNKLLGEFKTIKKLLEKMNSD